MDSGVRARERRGYSAPRTLEYDDPVDNDRMFTVPCSFFPPSAHSLSSAKVTSIAHSMELASRSPASKYWSRKAWKSSVEALGISWC